jgi:acyl-CoA reductase-like NAD-dependent aldehyde dehydrogenase
MCHDADVSATPSLEGARMTQVDVAQIIGSRLDQVFIGGQWVAGEGGHDEVVSPSSEQTVAKVALPSVEQASAAVTAAHDEGLRSWARLGVDDRVAAVRRLCDALEARLDEIGLLWAAEAGMAVRYSRTLHKFGAVGAWNAAISSTAEALAEHRRQGPMGEVLVRREPAGVVVGVMAYNGPLVTFGTKIVPALLAGCPVVVKGASESHLVMRVVAECAESAQLPPGTLSVLTGGTDIARALTTDPRVDLVSLTGGHAAAKDIVDVTSARFARAHLELGGKSAALILPDADVAHALRSLTPGATSGAGQVCALLSRVLVPESQHDEIVAALQASWGRLVVGDPFDPQTHIGPLVNHSALARTQSFLARAVDEGGRVVSGGRAPDGLEGGLYFQPTIVTDVRRDSHLARNEVFGPITAVLTYRDVDDAIDLVNDTDLGLAASVYTRDRALALDCASRITAGSVAINGFGPDVTAPWGGRARSGWGREGGPEGIQEFTELKQILVGPGLEEAASA